MLHPHESYGELKQLDIDASLSFLPKLVVDQLTKHNVVLAGGLIRSVVTHDEPKDIDIFCHSRQQADELAAETLSWVRRSTLSNTVTLDGRKVQYVYYREFADAKELIAEFDFTACCAAIWWTGLNGVSDVGRWDSAIIEGFYSDCEAKRLSFRKQKKDAGMLTPLSRALRLAKRGWDTSHDTLADILLHFNPLQDYATVRSSFSPAYGGAE